MSDLS